MTWRNFAAYIQHRAYQYRMMRLGRGKTHEEAYQAGVNCLIELIRTGVVKMDDIINQKQLELPFNTSK